MDADVRQLPRGRHGLAREEVLASQRGRLLASVLATSADRGYAGATVGQIVRGAGVSRETFYEHFSSKAECFLAAVDHAVDDFVMRARPVIHSGAEPLVKLDAFLGAYLAWLAERPAVGKALLLELRNAGEEAAERETAWGRRLGNVLCSIMGSVDEFGCNFYVNGLLRLVGLRLAEGEHEDLPQLRAPLVESARRLLAVA